MQVPEILQSTADRFRRKPTDQELVQTILDNGFRNVVSVACSITDTIDAQWQELARAGAMRLIRAAKEDVLPGIALGIYIGSGGKEQALMHMQNSGFPNAMDGLISFVGTYNLPAAALVTWRGSNDKDDSKPHQEIGKRTAPLIRDVVLDKESVFGRKDGRGFRRDFQKALDRAKSGKMAMARLSPDAFIKTYPMPEIGPRELDPLEFVRRMEEIQDTKGRRIEEVYKKDPVSREQAQNDIIEDHPLAIIVSGNGFNARALYDKNHREGNIYQVGYMGSASAIAFGMALINPDIDVVSLEGDQNAEMGHLITYNLAENYPTNLFRFILDNGRGVSVGAANSLSPLLDDYRFARVIRTIPEQPGKFKSKRLEAGITEEYDGEDDAKAMIERVGPLSFHIQRVIDVINQRTTRKIAERLQKPESSDVPRAFLS